MTFQIDTLFHGDCLQVMRQWPDNCVDAVVCDPPAGISFMGKDWDNPNTFPLEAGSGKRQDGGPSFGSGIRVNPAQRERDGFIAWLSECMAEAMRVTKPGGHAFVWAMPRTSHWTGTALEQAGWEIRDVIFHLFGSGFPKSLDISKAIDRMAGASREITAIKSVPGGWHHCAIMNDDGWKGNPQHITAPATEAAEYWQGYGTALKPAAEFWYLCRKPLVEASIAAQVLETGTGALNIDACRVGTHESTMRNNHVPRFDGIYNKSKPTQRDWQSGSTHGRFPANLLLSHSLLCVPRGMTRVRGGGGPAAIHQNAPKTLNTYGDYAQPQSSISHRDPDGMEEVEEWECAPDCPILLLNRQSGIRKNGGYVYPENSKQNSYWGLKQYTETHYAGDAGGAARYFTNFPSSIDDLEPFFYTSKASRTERNQGCEELPFHTPGECTDREEGSIGLSNLRAGAGRTGGNNNSHPTVKNLALMSWLCRLVCPPGGIVLDCFAGSGSTLVAAIQEGMHFVGIEKEEDYFQIAQARIADALKNANFAQAPLIFGSPVKKKQPARKKEQELDFVSSLWEQEQEEEVPA